MEMEAEWLRRNEGGEQCGKYTRGRMAAEAKRDKEYDQQEALDPSRPPINTSILHSGALITCIAFIKQTLANLLSVIAGF